MANFAIMGVGGFVAPRHLEAIRETGNRLIAACDPHDSVGLMDNYFPDAAFFTEVERFDRFLEKRRREGSDTAVNYVSICSPNYLHDAHVRLALRVNAHAICEKPLVINPWNLDQLQSLEEEYDTRIRTVLQLRYLPALLSLKEQFQRNPPSTKKDVLLTYITRRGRWYHHSWKGSEEKSGGLAMNIGIHLFDMMIWIFGDVAELEIHARERNRVSGVMELEHASVRWFLSIDESDLPQRVRDEGGHAYRLLLMDGEAIEFSTGFRDLHTTVYRETIGGRGHGIDDARPSIELAYRVRTQPTVKPRDSVHPALATP
jgi:UDP-N-acetyl-2-amino-2-deoxyglucuronate dehydrogenase